MDGKRSGSFYVLTVFFVLFIVFLYGPTITIAILSFQGPSGGLTFPMNGTSLHWFRDLFEQQAVGDIWGSFQRSFALGFMVMVTTVVVSVMGGLAFRKRFAGSTILFYLIIRDQGASNWQTIRYVVLPIIAPSLIGVALFGFTLSYDEFARTLLTAGSYNTLPLEIFGMTTNVTTPVLYALGTLTTIFSFLMIGVFLIAAYFLNRRRVAKGSDAGQGML